MVKIQETATSLLSEDLFEAVNLTQMAKKPSPFERHRIGILGGTFNPPHLGHLLIAEQVGCQLELDEVWFMPTAKPPHAPGKKTIASRHRLEMTQLAIASNDLFKLQPYEIQRGGTNYTVDTMRHFVEVYPQSDFYFIIGQDSANDLPTWRGVDELVQLCQLVGVQRPGQAPYEGPYPILWVDTPTVDLSSSEIRLRVYLEQSIRYQVPRQVEDYIYQHDLYHLDI
ncbi:nicotinate-nucleotide adenylyltransferase [Hutsoniella sourekii]|uniref:nicotinate-nucleotide adenylyltransferase n=1 Tax=Hutsoniella sourekii TaxID=87650 RepID=UPI000489252C|nr:nicotinate-nucleotide adenylyltransferase [Hutsoniella sourekii]